MTIETQPLPARPLNLSSLPVHLAPLVQRAVRGELVRGPVMLASGLVLDLGGYVLAWASSWPADRAHTLRRLEEAHTVWTEKSSQVTRELRQSSTGQLAQFSASLGEFPHVGSTGEVLQLEATSRNAKLSESTERTGGAAELPQSKAALGQIAEVPGEPR